MEPTAHNLVVSHLPGSEPPRFRVELRGRGQVDSGREIPRSAEPTGSGLPSHDPPEVAIPPVDRYPVSGMSRRTLGAELRWYLEGFLDYPFAPQTERRDQVLRALDEWGKAASDVLFGVDPEMATTWMDGGESLRLIVRGNDPRVLSWPWEAVGGPPTGPLSRRIRVERCLDLSGPKPLRPQAPTADRIRILLVIARGSEDDVGYRSVARSVVELASRADVPAQVHLLRPPTFRQLVDHLRERPGFYHVFHFDGHGTAAERGALFFESEAGERTTAIPAADLAWLFEQTSIPIAVLNACRSAAVEEHSGDVFASVAASLLEAGTCSVVAMSYRLNVRGAQLFLDCFYRELFESGDVSAATAAGRRAMAAEPDRICARGYHPLQDWLVPVLYRQTEVHLSFPRTDEARRRESDQDRSDDRRAKFFGRDGMLLRLERALRSTRPVILIHGLGGVGKTSLAHAFVEWLRKTNGLPARFFWFRGDEIRTAEFVLNRLGEELHGPSFPLLERREQLRTLIDVLRHQSLLVVWDNFEVVTETLPAADREDLLSLLQGLEGSPGKVLITSRRDESWLRPQCCRIPLTGLSNEDRWELFQHLVDASRVDVDRGDPAQVTLLDLLAGHPLAMRVMVPRLADFEVGELLTRLRTTVAELTGAQGGEEEKQLFAPLRVALEAVPADLRILLCPLALHHTCVDSRMLTAMAGDTDSGIGEGQVGVFLDFLATAGLLHRRGPGVFELHPALGSYLSSTVLAILPEEEQRRWTQAFVGVFASVAQTLGRLPLHRQRPGFRMHHVNLRVAAEHAEEQGLASLRAGLVQTLGLYAQNLRNFEEAREAFEQLAKIARTLGHVEGEGGAYHQLGRIAEARHEYDTASELYHKALRIHQEQGHEANIAKTSHHLGTVAEERRDYEAAEGWYRKSLAIDQENGNEPGAARTLFQLGRVAFEQEQLDLAETRHQQALRLFRKHGQEDEEAKCCHALGMVAEKQRDLAAAESWYRAALSLELQQRNEYGAAITFHELGILAQEQEDFETAKIWFRKALYVHEKQGDEYNAAKTYHQLGIIAREQEDFPAAASWYQRSLDINEKQGDEHGAALTCAELGLLASWHEGYEAAAAWLLRSLRTFKEMKDQTRFEEIADFYLRMSQQVSPDVLQKLRLMWEQSLGEWPLSEVP